MIKRMLIVAKQLYPEFKQLIRELASFNTQNSQRKFKEMLIMQSHIIEKGLSLKETRIGFGVPKVKKLLHELSIYEKRYGDHETLYFVLSIVDAYIRFNAERGENNEEIIRLYKELSSPLDSTDQYSHLSGGIIKLYKKDVSEKATVDYEGFVKSRHSIRQFTGESIPISLIRRALSIAEYTPSACNRQPWRNYIFTKKENIIKILDIQAGARQFKEDVSCLILITSTPNAFLAGEINQQYVNGGLYAMNLLFSLHAMGLGAIPLNMGITKDRIQSISNICGMDSSDTPIMLIAVGQIPEQFEVAKSCRFSYADYSIFDEV